MTCAGGDLEETTNPALPDSAHLVASESGSWHARPVLLTHEQGDIRLTHSVAGLILAAGGGRRLGGLAKALLPHEGEFLVDRAVRVARLAGCDPVVVVLGYAAETVLDQTALDGCVVAVNQDWETGLGSSLRTGLAAVPPESECSAAAVLLVDQPFIGADALHAVLDAHQQGADIAAATYQGRRGHPVLFATRYWAEISASAVGDQGARAFLTAHESHIVTVPCDAFGSLDDIDTPADVAKLRTR
jgi:CTP:molybdopterin cytidylyltransferase MocA